MSEATTSSMADARDAEDTQWLEQGDSGLAHLLAKYEPVILDRCMARLRGADAAYDVAQNVMLRLVREFREGKRYPVPYRVVVHKVIGWTLNDHFGNPSRTQPLDEGWDTLFVDAELERTGRPRAGSVAQPARRPRSPATQTASPRRRAPRASPGSPPTCTERAAAGSRAQLDEAGRGEVAVEGECLTDPQRAHQSEARGVHERVRALVAAAKPRPRLALKVGADAARLEPS